MRGERPGFNNGYRFVTATSLAPQNRPPGPGTDLGWNRCLLCEVGGIRSPGQSQSKSDTVHVAFRKWEGTGKRETSLFGTSSEMRKRNWQRRQCHRVGSGADISSGRDFLVQELE